MSPVENPILETPMLEINGITKRFGSVTANNKISFSIDRGEVVALLGENGAGKTTLMNILFGHYMADEGDIKIDGAVLEAGSTDAAINAGIGMVHQHFTVADNLTVLENVILGTEPIFALKSRRGEGRQKLINLSKKFGLEVNPDVLVGSLTVGERQRVEILKALYRDAKILILDEPTAVLTPQESESLFETLKELSSNGLAMIFISHKLHEILAVSDKVCVLRRGEIVGTVETKTADRNQLAAIMVGEEVTRPIPQEIEAGAPIISIENLSAKDENSVSVLKQINLKIHAHEIVGIAGVAGNGQSQLAEVLCGIMNPSSGQISIKGKPYDLGNPSKIVKSGVGRIPEDRHARGMVGEMTIWENMLSESLTSSEMSRFGLINKAAAKDKAEQLIKRFDVRCENGDATSKLLSGGNIQKLILARVLSANPSFILANQPVRGLDEGAIAYVQEQLLDARQRGAGILLISEDLDELMALSDSIVVMHHGEMSAPFKRGEKTIAEIGLMMAGELENSQSNSSKNLMKNNQEKQVSHAL